MPTLPRLFVEAALSPAASLALTQAQAHYLGTVLRLAVGEAVAVFNGRDGAWRATVAEIDRKRGVLVVERQTRPQSDESSGPWLLFAPLKKTTTDFVVEKATELGASALWPVQTARTNAGRVNEDRVRLNALEAAEQCERLTVPQVHPLTPLERVLEAWPSGRRLFVADESGQGVVPMAQAFAAHPGDAAVLIGPEGGFTKSELDRLRQSSFVSTISLGPRILRAETAALAALACWQAVCGDGARSLPADRL